jgi:hypothetical protein
MLTEPRRTPTVVPMRAAALAALALLIGCAHRPRHAGGDPAPLLGAWAEAIARDQPTLAYKLLSADVRAHLGEGDFTTAWRSALPDLQSQREALRTQTRLRQADAELPDGRALALAREGQHWRIASPRPLGIGGDTPEDTVRRLLAAVEARDFDAVLALLADPLRSTLEQAVGDRVERLKAALRRGPLDSAGTPARIRYDSRYHLDLVQENGKWRVADFN